MAENLELVNISDPDKVSLVFFNQCYARNHRYLFAYYESRLLKIRDLRWDTGPVLPSHLRNKLSSHENDYFIEYNNILTDYCQQTSFDLTADLQVYPTSLPHTSSPTTTLPHLPTTLPHHHHTPPYHSTPTTTTHLPTTLPLHHHTPPHP